MSRKNLGLDVGQAQELKLAFRRHDWDNELIKRLCESNILGDALDILRGDAQAVPIERVVDLGAEPEIKDGSVVVKHVKQGVKPWRDIRLALIDPRDLHYTRLGIPYDQEPPDQRIMEINPRTMRPHFLKGQRPANILMRDFLLEIPHLIPHDWVPRAPIVFWGTVCKSDTTYWVPGINQDFGGWYAHDCRVEMPRDRIMLRNYDNPCVVLTSAPSIV